MYVQAQNPSIVYVHRTIDEGKMYNRGSRRTQNHNNRFQNPICSHLPSRSDRSSVPRSSHCTFQTFIYQNARRMRPPPPRHTTALYPAITIGRRHRCLFAKDAHEQCGKLFSTRHNQFPQSFNLFPQKYVRWANPTVHTHRERDGKVREVGGGGRKKNFSKSQHKNNLFLPKLKMFL